LPDTNLPSLSERAVRTLADIEKHFSLGPGLYREITGKPAPSFNWGQGVMASALIAAAENIDRNTYLPLLDAQTETLRRRYWRSEGPVPGYNAPAGGGLDRYYDDNAWFAIAYGDAAAAGLGRHYAEYAHDALTFSLSGADPKLGGILWHEQDKSSDNTCAVAPTAVAAVEFANDVATGKRLYDWLHATLRDPADGLYWDNIRLSDNHIAKDKWSYNTALVIRLALALAKALGQKSYLDQAVEMADASIGHWYDPVQGILKDDASFAHLLNEALLMTYTATKSRQYRDVPLKSVDTLWTSVRRPDGSYPKRWGTTDRGNAPTEILWITSAARAYAYAVPFADKPR